MLNSYIVVDIETSGLYPECGDRILALSALKFEHEKLNDSYSWNLFRLAAVFDKKFNHVRYGSFRA